MITTRAELLAALKPGARLELADGRYGALALSRLADVQIAGGPGAVFDTVALSEVDGVTLDGISVDWTPTGAKDTVVRVAASKRVTLLGLKMRGGAVTQGVAGALSAEAVPPPPMNSFLVGHYAGRAAAIEFSEDVVVERCDISGFFQGVSVGKSSRVRIAENHIHRLRTTPIKGGGTDVSIVRNLLEHMTPYRYVDPSTGKAAGDHFDFIHMYTGAGAPITGLNIAENLLDAAGGEDAIGIYLQDKAQAGIIAPQVTENVILTGRNEGVALSEGVTDARVDGNVCLGPPGTLKPPTFVPRTATLASVSGNTWAENSTRPRHSETFPDNTYLPREAAPAEAVEAARAAWLQRWRPAPAADPRDARIADLEVRAAELAARLADAEAATAAGVRRLAEVIGERDALALRVEAARAALA